MGDKRRYSDSFVVRIWREESVPGWRGWVQHARSGDAAFIRNLEDLVAFFERWTGTLEETTRREDD